KGSPTRPELGFAYIRDTARIDAYLTNPQVKILFPSTAKFIWMHPSDKNKVTNKQLDLIAINVKTANKQAPLSGDIITDARVEYEQQNQGHPSISMTMTPAAGQIWATLTKANVGHSIAIVLDGFSFSAPTIINEIPNGRSSITGNFDPQEAKALASVLKAGRLPARGQIVSESVVGATLGAESIHAGLVSFLVALIIVLLFMILYYNKA